MNPTTKTLNKEEKKNLQKIMEQEFREKSTEYRLKKEEERDQIIAKELKNTLDKNKNIVKLLEEFKKAAEKKAKAEEECKEAENSLRSMAKLNNSGIELTTLGWYDKDHDPENDANNYRLGFTGNKIRDLRKPYDEKINEKLKEFEKKEKVLVIELLVDSINAKEFYQRLQDVLKDLMK